MRTCRPALASYGPTNGWTGQRGLAIGEGKPPLEYGGHSAMFFLLAPDAHQTFFPFFEESWWKTSASASAVRRGIDPTKEGNISTKHRTAHPSPPPEPAPFSTPTHAPSLNHCPNRGVIPLWVKNESTGPRERSK